MKSDPAVIFTALLFFLMTAIAGYNLTVPEEEVFVKIEPGTTGYRIAGVLREEGLILSKRGFLLLSNLTGATRKLQSGTYRFSKKMTSFEILRMLRDGKTFLKKMTVPEGFRAGQIAELVEKNGFGDRGRFMELVMRDNLEGYLFPETYLFPPDITEEGIIDAMKGQFENMYSGEFDKRAGELHMSRQKVVTLASIIEREAAADGERPIVSAVFHNRLKKRWRLESCATVRYALGNYDRKLRYKDLDVESDYNTYRKWGLPPGPICNPGLKSIKAALYPDPDSGDTMFFFSKEGKTHEFSKYYEGHLEGQRKNRKKR